MLLGVCCLEESQPYIYILYIHIYIYISVLFRTYKCDLSPLAPSSRRPQAEAKPCKALASPLRASADSSGAASEASDGAKSSRASFRALMDLA